MEDARPYSPPATASDGGPQTRVSGPPFFYSLASAHATMIAPLVSQSSHPMKTAQRASFMP